MAKIDSAYDYYVSVYGNQKASRYDAHKKSELRKVYNTMVQSNKESPLYKIDNIDEASKFAIDIKESARLIQNVVASLDNGSLSTKETFMKRVAQSSNPDIIEACYVGSEDTDNPSAYRNYEITVDKLALPQINMGNVFSPTDHSFKEGSYSFDLTTSTSAYEFQYSIRKDDNNEVVLGKINNLINKSRLGLHSEILSDNKTIALRLTSNQTGLDSNEDFLFDISASGRPESERILDRLGIATISQEASNSSFTVDGKNHSSFSNTFTLNKIFELTLADTTLENEPVVIGFKTNTDAVADNINRLLDSYNNMVGIVSDYARNDSREAARLHNDLLGVSYSRIESLKEIGVNIEASGEVILDKSELEEALSPSRIDNTFSILEDYKDAISTRANDIAIDPLRYVDKVVVEYKNPGHNFTAPYASSLYSGMMHDTKT